MKRKALLFAPVLDRSALPATAAAPPFDTPAPVAFMKDLASGAVLYAKDPDRRIPPASMAKMMTTHLAFPPHQAGRAQARQGLHGAAGDLAQVARPAGRLDHVPVGGRAGQRREPAARHRHPVRQ
jgi:D-alanyl-D-alanine carboxypeptidase